MLFNKLVRETVNPIDAPSPQRGDFMGLVIMSPVVPQHRAIAFYFKVNFVTEPTQRPLAHLTRWLGDRDTSFLERLWSLCEGETSEKESPLPTNGI